MSIDSHYERALAKLTKQNKIVDISNKLLILNNNADRVLFVYQLVKETNLFPKLIQVDKSTAVSTHYRNLGNACFKKHEDYKAWQYYNLSLLHAPTDSKAYTLAYSNRSAVFQSMKKYKESLNDINKTLSLTHSEDLKEKLLKRQKACEGALTKEVEEKLGEEISFTDEISLEVTGPRDPIYQCASSKLEVICSPEMGRHVVAREDIKVGEVLVQENPYLILLLKSQFLFVCNYCLSRNLNMLPCDKCCFSLYCSEDCKTKAYKEYHNVECCLMATLIHMEFTRLELLALRTMIRARKDHDSWTSLFQTIQEAEASETTDYRGCVKIDDKWVYDSKYYTSIHCLASNVERRSVSDIFQKSLTAAVFLKLLETSTDFLKGKEDIEDVRKCVAGNLLHHIMTSPTNMHGISSTMQDANGDYVSEESIASAPYAYFSLLNHSCSPNVVRFAKSGTAQMTLIALRPIKKGMQLFDNYGSHHALESRFLRQKSLLFQYKFKCQCEACINDWPTYINLQPANLPIRTKSRKTSLLDAENIESLQKGDKETAIELLKPLCELAEELEEYAPCVELADCQESLKQCLAIIEGLVPFGYSQRVDWNAIPSNV